MVFYLVVRKVLRDKVFLCVVGRDNVDAVLVELHEWNTVVFMELMGLIELLQTEVFQTIDHISFFVIKERASFDLLSPVRHIDKEEGRVGVHKMFLLIGFVATFDLVVVEELVGDFHERLVHPILCVQEVISVSCVY